MLHMEETEITALFPLLPTHTIIFALSFTSLRGIWREGERKSDQEQSNYKSLQCLSCFLHGTCPTVIHLSLFSTKQPWYLRHVFPPFPSSPLSCSRGGYLGMWATPCPVKREIWCIFIHASQKLNLPDILTKHKFRHRKQTTIFFSP